MEGQRLHHFELSDKNRTVRWIFIIILLVVGAVALTAGLLHLLRTPAGWQAISPTSSTINGSKEFILQYDLGAGETSATEEGKALRLLYGQLSDQAYRIFYQEAGDTEETVGIYRLSSSPNRELTVDPHLYQALTQLEENGTRALYLAPVYSAYNEMFYAVDTVVAEANDPTTNEQLRQQVQTLANFANDPQSVQLQLLGDNRVYLQVSEEYGAFLQENEITQLLDFGWLRNAFVIDYLAQQLQKAGYTNGYLFSVDGFTRNLDQRGTGYSFQLMEGGKGVGELQYPGATSFAFLHSYPMYQEDAGRFYRYADGRTVTTYIDPADGQSKTALEQLVSYSTTAGCAELAMSMLPLYVTEDFDEALVNQLKDKNIYSIWFSGSDLRYNAQGAKLTLADASRSATYAG